MAETTLGQRIARVRERAGLTQTQMAKRFGDSDRQATASDWERGKTVPDTATIMRLVKEAGVNGHWLLTGEGDIDDVPDLAQEAVAEIEQTLQKMRARGRERAEAAKRAVRAGAEATQSETPKKQADQG